MLTHQNRPKTSALDRLMRIGTAGSTATRISPWHDKGQERANDRLLQIRKEQPFCIIEIGRLLTQFIASTSLRAAHKSVFKKSYAWTCYRRCDDH